MKVIFLDVELVELPAKYGIKATFYIPGPYEFGVTVAASNHQSDESGKIAQALNFDIINCLFGILSRTG